jgi:hypothetical protein
MPQSLRLTFCFLRIPRLLATLLLAPVATTVLIVILQLFVSVLFLQAPNSRTNLSATTGNSVQLSVDEQPSWFREILIGDPSFAKNLKICAWSKNPDTQKLDPPSADCQLERFDVVVTPDVVNQHGIAAYEELFRGLFRAVHICDGCGTDIIIWRSGAEIKTYFRSFLGLVLFQEVHLRGGIKKRFDDVQAAKQELKKRIGERYFDLTGFREPTRLSSFQAQIVIILNIGLGIVTALWLALKAHRRVLDYLSHSGVLLPLVAAVGKSTFYSSVWLLTLIRVGAFVLATVPIGLLVFLDVVSDSAAFPFYGRPLAFVGWSCAVIASFSLAALIASVAELKHHHDLFNIHYKLGPLLASSLGGLLWLSTFLIEFPGAQTIRSIIGTIPIVGIAPILLAPAFEPYWYVLGVNTIGTIAIIILVARYNARWFGSHLDDI